MLCKVTHCTGPVSANTKPHQLHWGDRTAVSSTKCSQVAGLHAVGRDVSKAASLHVAIHCSCVQLYACGGVWGEEEYIVYMCGSPRIEIEYYSVAYFERSTEFDAL